MKPSIHLQSCFSQSAAIHSKRATSSKLSAPPAYGVTLHFLFNINAYKLLLPFKAVWSNNVCTSYFWLVQWLIRMPSVHKSWQKENDHTQHYCFDFFHKIHTRIQIGRTQVCLLVLLEVQIKTMVKWSFCSIPNFPCFILHYHINLCVPGSCSQWNGRNRNITRVDKSTAA